MATIKDIARECGVSIATVSNILNEKGNASEETRKMVLATARRLDYVPNYMAKSLKQKETRVVGIITEDLTVFNCTSIVDGIHAYLEGHSYTFLLGNLRLFKRYNTKFYHSDVYHSLVDEEIRIMQARQVDGIIYIGAHCRRVSCIPPEITMPIVLAYSTSQNHPSVIFDDKKAAYDAMSVLISRGHKRIGIIAGEEQSLHTKERLLGCQQALFHYGILFNPDLLYYGDWIRSKGYEGARILLEGGATAIFSMNDVMAGGVYDYAVENNLKIGSDISLIGFDNREICTAFRPSLATMALPLSRIGEEAARLMTRILEHKITSDETIYKIPCTFIERASL